MGSRRSSSVLGGIAILAFIAAPLLVAWSPPSDGHAAHAAAPSSDEPHAGHDMGTAPASDPHAGHAMPMPGPLPPAISAAKSGDFKTGQPFSDPPKILSRNGELKVTLTAFSMPVRISGKLVNARVYGASAYGKSYAPSFAPPTLVTNPGDTVIFTLVNKLPEPTNVHTHGWFVSPMGNSDDIYASLPSGSTLTYQYLLPKDLAPGTYWYHPHEHGLVEEQVFGGLAGFLYVKGLKEMLPDKLADAKEHFIMLKDMQLNKGNSIMNTNIDSNKPTNRFVNGLMKPVMQMKPGETQMWHIGNMSADIWYTLAAAGMQFHVIAEDGNPVDTPWTVSDLLIAPGKRFDVIVRAPKSGSVELKTMKMSTGPAGDTYPTVGLATIELAGQQQKAIPLPKTVRPANAPYWIDLLSKPVAKERTFVLTEDKNGFYINGKSWSENFIDATPLKGTVEQWTYINETGEDHPIHIHVNDMQVVTINGVAQSTNWVDTQKVPAMTKDASGAKQPGRVVVRMDFRKYVGTYVFHCHILAHEDNGMMGNVTVTTSPSSPQVVPAERLGA